MGEVMCRPGCKDVDDQGIDLDKKRSGLRKAARSTACFTGAAPVEVPILLLHHMQEGDLKAMEQSQEHFKRRLKGLLTWAAPLAPDKLSIVEFRIGKCNSMLPELMGLDHSEFENRVRVVDVSKGYSANIGLYGPRALVCGGILEMVLYPCHDLLMAGFIEQVAIVPQLCGTSGRSGELKRSHTISHLEEVLGVQVLGSVKSATQWLVPGSPAPEELTSGHDIDIVVVSEDNTVLDEFHKQLVSLVLPENVQGATLKKLGKGWSAAMKFFCIPIVNSKNAGTQGAMTFLKMGAEEDIEEELEVTQYMMQLLGNFCPQVLGYSELGETAAIHLSLADLGTEGPRGFADLYCDLVSAENPVAGTNAGRALQKRVEGAVDFVFGTLLKKLHSAKGPTVPTFSVADDLGFTRDLPDGMNGMAEVEKFMSSRWVLEKLWKRSPGDGKLVSSVAKHIAKILGKDAISREKLTFLEGHPLTLTNVCLALKEDSVRKLQDASTGRHQIAWVHGDLHGDNIMVDNKDNRFLIDFGKTSLGHCLEDVTWLESFLLLSYTDLVDDDDFGQALSLVPALAPPGEFTPDTLQTAFMESRRNPRKPLNPRMQAAWDVVLLLRRHLVSTMHDLVSGPTRTEQLAKAGLVAVLLLWRNSLFFMAARENENQPRRKRLALAYACAYAETALSMCQHVQLADMRVSRRSSSPTAAEHARTKLSNGNVKK